MTIHNGIIRSTYATWTFFLSLFLLPSALLAHGPAPSPLNVLEITSDLKPDLVTTSMGLTFGDANDTYIYGCPSQWGSSDLVTPLTASLDAQTMMVVGADTLYVATQRACLLEPLVLPSETFAPIYAADLHAVDGRIWGIANKTENGQSTHQAWAWHPEQGFDLVWALENRKIDTLASAGGTIFLAGGRPDPVLMRLDTTRLDADFANAEQLLEVQELELNQVQRLSLRLIQDAHIWMMATQDDGLSLMRSDDDGQTWKEIGRATTAIHGPVPMCGGVVAVVDGVLMADPDVSPTCSFEALQGRQFACLRHVDGVSYFCELRQLKRIVEPTEPTGAISIETWYQLEQITGPDRVCVRGDEPERLACTQDWLHEAGEAGLITDFTGFDDLAPDAGTPDAMGAPDAASPSEPSPSSTDSCSTAPSPRSAPLFGWWLWLVGGALLSVAKRRG